eukprot:TRINITY_DN32574_c0_g1_i1.p1 TRINITY_DN32574_c0_g1~~TRINITY_DN32574_c0_g1_i1.p1  ORF type:complete len:675 (-),score=63.25 TRINITY_DN32574_c0_g1_i1:122-2146(-)
MEVAISPICKRQLFDGDSLTEDPASLSCCQDQTPPRSPTSSVQLNSTRRRANDASEDFVPCGDRLNGSLSSTVLDGAFLMDAIVAGDVSRAQGAILAGAEPNAVRDSRGYTALHLAVIRGIYGLSRLLLDNAADVNAPVGKRGLTALHFASMGGHTSLVKMLLKANADPSLLNVAELSSSGSHAFGGRRHATMKSMLLAAEGGASDAEASRISDGNQSPTATVSTSSRRRCGSCFGDPKDPLRGFDGTVVINAILSGDMLQAQGMILAGADVNSARDSQGHTALHLASIHGKVGLVRLLINHSADIDATSGNNQLTALHFAALHGRRCAVKLLVESRAKVNASTADGDTALSLSALDGNLEIVRHLVEAGAQAEVEEVFDTSTSRPESPRMLRRAVQSNTDKEVIAELVRAGASVGATETDAEPPLVVAAQNGNVRVARFLLESRADPDGCNQSLHTPLHFAARNGASRLIRLLAEGRAEVNSQDRDGLMPIQYAVDRATERQLHRLGAREVGDGPWHTRAKMMMSPPSLSLIASPGCTSPSSPSGSVPGSPMAARCVQRGGNIRTASRTQKIGPHRLFSRDICGSTLCSFTGEQQLARSASTPSSPLQHSSGLGRPPVATPPTSPTNDRRVIGSPLTPTLTRGPSASPPASFYGSPQRSKRHSVVRKPQMAWG